MVLAPDFLLRLLGEQGEAVVLGVPSVLDDEQGALAMAMRLGVSAVSSSMVRGFRSVLDDRGWLCTVFTAPEGRRYVAWGFNPRMEET